MKIIRLEDVYYNFYLRIPRSLAWGRVYQMMGLWQMGLGYSINLARFLIEEI